MISVLSSRRLFQLALQIYFGCSLTLFLWYGSKMGSMQATQKERSYKDSRSFYLTLSFRQIYGDTEYQNDSDEDIGPLSDANFFKNIILKGDDNNATENDIGEGIESYPEKMSYEYNEDVNDANIKQEIPDTVKVHGANNVNSSEHKNKTMAQKWIQMVRGQINVYDHQVVRRVKDIEVFYITAVSTNVSHGKDPAADKTTDTVAVNGWQGKGQRTTTLFCCFKGNNSLHASEVFKRNIWDVPDIKVITATQFLCNLSEAATHLNHLYVGLSEKASCKNVEYIKLEFEMKPPSKSNASFAVCSKIVYGNFSASRLLEWIEVNKAFGVDSISLFTYNITKEMMTVLKHYQEEGFLNMKEFDYPLKLRYPRYLGQKYMMAYMDEQVTVFDCARRFRQYTYIAVIDVDEFIMPKIGPPSYKPMMEKMLKLNQNAAGFTLMTALFVLDWNKTHPEADFTIGQYTLRTAPIWDRRKSIIVTDRVELSTVWTHGFNPLGGYNRHYLYKKEAVIHHYRKCRSQWISSDTCYTNRKQYGDASMKRALWKARKTLVEKRKELLLY